MTSFGEILEREYRQAYRDHIQYDRGESRGIARKAAQDIAQKTIVYRLPYHRKLTARLRAHDYWRANHE